jgi:hypothetical protein
VPYNFSLAESHLKENNMLRASLFVGLAIGMSLLAVGCGGGTPTGDPSVILKDFQRNSKEASQKYEGKTVRLSVKKVISAGKVTVNAKEFVTVQGQVGGIVIDATVSDPAHQQKALALKIGDPATFEGEPAGGMGEVAGMGALFMKSAKVVSE